MPDDFTLNCSISIRLTDGEGLKIRALAACDGKKPSPYIRQILLEHISRPRPNLAAASELLAICQALLEVAEGGTPLTTDTRQFILERAEMVFEILRLHGHQGSLQ
jgi:hypothetical protein